MRRILAGTFVLALFAVASAGPPIDYELTCGVDGDLIGVVRLTDGTVHVALVEDATCELAVVVVSPEGAPEIGVAIDWATEPLTVDVTFGEEPVEAEGVDVVVVPQVAIDGMLHAHSLRAAAMEMRQEAYAKGGAAREGRVDDADDGEGDGGGDSPAGPPEGVPPVDAPGRRP